MCGLPGFCVRVLMEEAGAITAQMKLERKCVNLSGIEWNLAEKYWISQQTSGTREGCVSAHGEGRVLMMKALW